VRQVSGPWLSAFGLQKADMRTTGEHVCDHYWFATAKAELLAKGISYLATLRGRTGLGFVDKRDSQRRQDMIRR